MGDFEDCLGFVLSVVLLVSTIGAFAYSVYVSDFKSESVIVVSGSVEFVELHGCAEVFGRNVSVVRVAGRDYKGFYDVSDGELLGLVGKSVVIEYGFVRDVPLSSDLPRPNFIPKMGAYFATIKEVKNE